MRVWQLQEAKNKFSEVVEGAVKDGPQVVTRRGVETAIVISYDEYRKITLCRGTLSEFFGGSPLAGVELDLTRDKSPARDDIPL